MRREITEEVGLKRIKILDKIYDYRYPWEGMMFYVSAYAVEASMDEKIKIQTETVEEMPISDFIWVSKEEAIKMLYWKDEKEVIKSFKS